MPVIGRVRFGRTHSPELRTGGGATSAASYSWPFVHALFQLPELLDTDRSVCGWSFDHERKANRTTSPGNVMSGVTADLGSTAHVSLGSMPSSPQRWRNLGLAGRR